jgi:hypothetical protein
VPYGRNDSREPANASTTCGSRSGSKVRHSPLLTENPRFPHRSRMSFGTHPAFPALARPQYTATATVLYPHELGLVPITTPA